MPLLYPASTGHTVDDKYSALVEPNLFAANVFQPGVTFTDKYQIGPAGQIMVHKPGVGTVTPTAPGADYTDAIVQDSIVTISLDKQFNRSRKIYGATAASVAYPIAASELETGLQEIKAAWNKAAAKSFLTTTSLNKDTNILTVLATDGSDAYGTIVNSRQILVEKNANPDTLIVTPATYSKLLKAPEFQRSTQISDMAIADGVVGRIAGLNVFEYSALNASVTTGDAVAGITLASGDEIEYIIYDSDAFSIITSVEQVRVVDSERFNGTLAQVEIVSGFKLTNPDRAIVKLHDASAS